MLTDNSPMPYGVYEGVPMANVPADYLLHLHFDGSNNEHVAAYILENLSALEQEVNQSITVDLPDETWDTDGV